MADDSSIGLPLDGLAKWIGGLTAVILAVVALRAAVQQLFPDGSKDWTGIFAKGDGPPARAGSYILPASGQARLTSADLAGLSAAQLRLARNEIYARHGRRFANADLQTYFAGQP